jgi:hypothetical protein
MSRRRKHVRSQLDESCPELNPGDAVCRVVDLRGSTLWSVSPTESKSPPAAAAAAAKAFVCYDVKLFDR